MLAIINLTSSGQTAQLSLKRDSHSDKTVFKSLNKSSSHLVCVMGVPTPAPYSSSLSKIK